MFEVRGSRRVGVRLSIIVAQVDDEGKH